jgi:PAS domain S-box-containing protein
MGNITGAIQVIRDITETKRSEKSLKESEEQYRSLFESSQDAIFLLENTRFKKCNARAVALFGCTKMKEIVGRSLVDFSPVMQSDRASSEQKVQEKISAALGDSTQVFDWLFTRLDGNPIQGEVTLSRVIIGGKTLLQAIVRDVSERKRAEDALKKSERTYRTVVEDQTELISRFRPDGTQLFVNEAFCQYFKKSREDLVGNPWEKIFPQDPGRRSSQGQRTLCITHQGESFCH